MLDRTDRESSPKRPVLSVAEVYRLADAIEPRHRHWSWLQPSATCAGASWPGCITATSTSTTALRLGYPGRPGSSTV